MPEIWASAGISRNSPVPAKSAATTRLTTTYLGRESLTVPAGTFETCKAKFVDQTGATSLTWTVASGPYRGIDIRFATLNALNGSTLWFSEATSIEANLQ